MAKVENPLVTMFRRWLSDRVSEAERAGAGQHGSQSAAARRLGLKPDRINKILSNAARGDIRLSTLDVIARHMGLNAWELLRKIEVPKGRPDKTASGVERVVRLSDLGGRYRHQWDQLFHDDPARGRKVLNNLLLQERLGLTDTVSAVVHAILESGPADAIPQVATILNKAGKHETPTQRRLRKQAFEQEA